MAQQTIQVADVEIKPGERQNWIQEVIIQSTKIHFPVIVINGKKPGPTLVVTGGIHGAEYASIEAALRLGRTLQPEHLKGCVVIVPVANMPAFRARSIYQCPLDGINLNRVFPGVIDGGPTEQLGFWLFENIIRLGDYYVDMHGGDLVEALTPFTIYPETGNEEADSASLKIAQVFGISTLVRSTSSGSTFFAAAQAGIPAILTEAGGQGVWREDDILLHMKGVERLMGYLEMVEMPPLEEMPTRVLEKSYWLRSEHEGYYYPAVSVGEIVKNGQYLGKVTDFLGNVLQMIESPDDGTVLFLVTSLAINEGDPLLSIAS